MREIFDCISLGLVAA